MRCAPQVDIRTPDTGLLTRAREFLRHGPADPTTLIAYVCRMSSLPRPVADQLARELLGRTPAFTLDLEGRWMLAAEVAAGGQRQPDQYRRPLRELSYVVVDVETTGTRALSGDRITEVAAVTVERSAVVHVYQSLVNPERPIPSCITALTRITRAMVRRAPRFGQIAAPLAAALRGHVFVAHNAAFDWRFINAEMERCTGTILSGERLCTVRLARAFAPQLRRRCLDALACYFGVEIENRHRAGGDAVATARILVRLLTEAESRGCATLGDVQQAIMAARATRRRRRRALPHYGDADLCA
jgi:DNA polymerase-3 subunit epsilon